MPHPSQDRLLRYATGDSTEDEAERVIGHLDGCRTCEERVVALRALRHDFEGAWESFLEEASFRGSLPQAVARKAQVEATFLGWLGKANRFATAAMERLTATGEAAGLKAAFVPVYSGVASPEASAAAIKDAEAASEACARGDNDAALEHLRRASSRDPQVSSSAGIDLLLGERVAGRVVVDAERASISVLVYPDVLEGAKGRIVFEQAGTKRELNLQSVPGAAYLLAELEGLGDGPFSIKLQLS
ncbi:MAG TPA: hypothetical protein VFP10_04040 [Candidatus Eisenbacteria bacterium]|nr:hypothetical protein [Candidatus Eisenbacteria bacterium]